MDCSVNFEVYFHNCQGLWGKPQKLAVRIGMAAHGNEYKTNQTKLYSAAAKQLYFKLFYNSKIAKCLG